MSVTESASRSETGPRAADSPAPTGTSLVRGIGPVAATALVVGNMIGSGIFVMPASLADTAGPLGLVAWAINTAGYLCLTAVFADLGGAYPVSGGLQAFARRAFGDFVGLEVGFLYWLCAVIGNAAFLTAFVGYLAVLWPAANDPLVAFAVSQALLWGLTLTNYFGVRAGGVVQVVTVVCKLLPLLVLSVALWPSASLANLEPFAPKGWGMLLPAVSLVSWLFIGMESITVPAEEIRGAGRTIRRSVYTGFFLTSAVYLLVLGSLSLAVPAGELAQSASPLADVAASRFGATAATLVTLGALLSVGGILNGWVLVTSRMAYATARAGLAPRWLSQLSPRYGTPGRALAITAVLSGALVGLYFSGSTLEIYNFIALMSTATALVAIGASCLAQLVLMRREPDRFTPQQRRRGPFTATLALVVVVLMIAGSGPTIVALTAGCLLVPVPFYLRHVYKTRHSGTGAIGHGT